MIRRRVEGDWSIRAIVTRHDQTQIDHVNDAALLAQMRFCFVTTIGAG